MVKRLASAELDEGQRNLVEVIPLGAGQEVGRSCIILRYMCAPVVACSAQTDACMRATEHICWDGRAATRHACMRRTSAGAAHH